MTLVNEIYRLEYSVEIGGAFEATSEAVTALVEAALDSLEHNGATNIEASGHLGEVCTMQVSFDLNEISGAYDMYPRGARSLLLLVDALHSARLAVPGWPDSDQMEEAIGTAKIKHFPVLFDGMFAEA